MQLPRRKFLHLATGAAAFPAFPRLALALEYPTRPVRIIVSFAAGNASDISARLMAQWLSERLGQQFIVENKPGAGTNVGTEAVVRARPDGYTLLFVVLTNAINVSLYHNLEFNFIEDITPVAGIARVPVVMVVTPSFPAKTVSEFIAYAKANPGKINFASGGIGSINHVAAELFEMMTGVDMVHVPYNGNPRPDLLAGRVQVMFDTLPAAIGLVRTGKLRALAVGTAARQSVLPDVPTIAESVAGYEASGWQGIGAPKNIPGDIVERLNSAINAGLADAQIKARLATLGGAPMPMTAAEFKKFVADETEKWAKVIKFAGIKPA
jgi:tripartite-type tricarboxylate transporter receptor subunit TctC